MSQQYDVYKDIKERTKGDMYIGVVGPVRTGKSTFIKRFMECLVLPAMEDGPEKLRTIDELPQSGSGKTITTTEPKFIPKESISITMNDEIDIKVRLVDCVGYIVDGATGHVEEGIERLVKTPWFDYEIPFSKAAMIGTKKVMTDHSTIGIVVTTDGSIGDISRESYEEVEESIINEMKELGKPFVVLLNSVKPMSQETKDLAQELSFKYKVKVLPVNCEQLKNKDILEIMNAILLEFPIVQVNFYIPRWAETLDSNHPIKVALYEYAKTTMKALNGMKDVYEIELPEIEYIEEVNVSNINLQDGTINVILSIPEKYYYEMLSQLLDTKVENEFDFLNMMKEVANKRKAYNEVATAMESVLLKGYGIVMPEKEKIEIEEPELIKHGTKYGIKIKATAPSLHFIKANVSTEIAPIVGSKEQAEEFLVNMKEQRLNSKEAIWNTNIFGKTVEQMVIDGLSSKTNNINEESQVRLQDTMEKIMNDSNGGMVFIFI